MFERQAPGERGVRPPGTTGREGADPHHPRSPLSLRKLQPKTCSQGRVSKHRFTHFSSTSNKVSAAPHPPADHPRPALRGCDARQGADGPQQVLGSVHEDHKHPDHFSGSPHCLCKWVHNFLPLGSSRRLGARGRPPRNRRVSTEGGSHTGNESEGECLCWEGCCIEKLTELRALSSGTLLLPGRGSPADQWRTEGSAQGWDP